MDDEDIVRLSFVLQNVCATGRPIDDLDEIPSWFQGPESEVNDKVQEMREMFDDAFDAGLINRWVDESGRRGPSTYWDWTTTAHRRAFKKGLLLTNPMGEEEECDV